MSFERKPTNSKHYLPTNIGFVIYGIYFEHEQNFLHVENLVKYLGDMAPQMGEHALMGHVHLLLLITLN